MNAETDEALGGLRMLLKELETNSLIDSSDAERVRAAILCLEAAERRAESLEAECRKWKEQAFRPLGDNHHNATLCPYCSPDRAALEKRLRELRKYANHLDTCSAWSTECDDTAISLNADDCDCGLDEIDAALAPDTETPPDAQGREEARRRRVEDDAMQSEVYQDDE